MKKLPMIMGSLLLRALARWYGFMDPVTVLSRLQRFGKSSDTWVPMELLRYGAHLQVRGLMNSQVIQHNLDWIWPFWVFRQFFPEQKDFIPRAFSLTHINLTHRNWTALGLPNMEEFPIVDPAGMVTPFWDSWSIEAWIMQEQNSVLVPGRGSHCRQEMSWDDGLEVSTSSRTSQGHLESRAHVKMKGDAPVCQLNFTYGSNQPAKFVITARPYNPEGVSAVSNIECLPHGEGWRVNRMHEVRLQKKPDYYVFSNYEMGDVKDRLFAEEEHETHVECPMGMATAAAVYDIKAESQHVEVEIPLKSTFQPAYVPWDKALEGRCRLEIPDERMQYIYESALRTLVLLHNGQEVYPGPYTYKEFWFRDATFIINALLAANLTANLESIFDGFAKRQNPQGYFHSQNGEWDSNGQVLWIMQRFCECLDRSPKREWQQSLLHAADWIRKKRRSSRFPNPRHPLLPAGFSAEHFGPSDFYYWDDFWAVAGLRAVSGLLKGPLYQDLAQQMNEEADDLQSAIERSLLAVEMRLGHASMPAAPDRRMDSAAVGCLMASYPLQIWEPTDERLRQTMEYLLEHYIVDDGFYHAISHSGINAYLTLELAQALLRQGDARFFRLVQGIAGLASPTGQWPEAIHPHTRGGCMGDGQHVWAAAEWVMMVRNMFVREERDSQVLILASGIPTVWLRPGSVLSLGPTLTMFGPVHVRITVGASAIKVSWEGRWHKPPSAIEVHFPGGQKKILSPAESSMECPSFPDKEPV